MSTTTNTITYTVEEITTMQANLVMHIDGFPTTTVVATGPREDIYARLAKIASPACKHPLGFIFAPHKEHAICFDCGVSK